MNGFCSLCGAHIYPNRQFKHTSFHEEHAELVEWAQSVSELFKFNSTVVEGSLRGLLHSINDGIITPGEAMDRAGIELETPEN